MSLKKFGKKVALVGGAVGAGAAILVAAPVLGGVGLLVLGGAEVGALLVAGSGAAVAVGTVLSGSE